MLSSPYHEVLVDPQEVGVLAADLERPRLEARQIRLQRRKEKRKETVMPGQSAYAGESALANEQVR